MALESTQPLTEMSTRNLPGGKGPPEHKVDPHRHLWANFVENVGASTSHNAMGLHALLQGWILQRRDRFWEPPRLLANGYRERLPTGQSGRGVKLTTHLHLV
jgi:hypothetical protein